MWFNMCGLTWLVNILPVYKMIISLICTHNRTLLQNPNSTNWANSVDYVCK
ncbi:hypothetical protein HanIR_Chr01g0008181 [Helianthus annuus]|nr:hypothetical protein HanIR_Chr01g0008181 [Helianthus annuus]